MLGDRFVVDLADRRARHALRVYGLAGALEREIALPTLGSVGFSSQRRDREGFYAFTSFTYPTTVFRYDPATGASTPFKHAEAAPSRRRTSRPRRSSTRRRTARRSRCSSPAEEGLRRRTARTRRILYGYGGFNISLTPAFSAGTVAWLEHGRHLRGGRTCAAAASTARRGTTPAGSQHKQNVFDDFIAAAEYLITRAVHLDAEAGDLGRQQRRPAGRRGA